MATASGKYATVNGLGSLMEWSANDTRDGNAYVTSNTRCATGRGGGISDVSGTLSGKGGKPPVFPNETFAFQGYTAPNNGVEGGDGLIYSASMICRQITVTWNWVNNELLTWSAELAGRSSLSFADGAPYDDTTPVPIDYPCGQFLSYDGIEIPAISQATLTITANLFETSNSSTRDANGCFIDRGPGPLDWSLTATQEDHMRNMAGYPDLGIRNHELDLAINPTESWQLNFGFFSGYSGFSANRDGSVIARTLTWNMNAENEGTIGHIICPGETIPQWPTPTGP